MVQHILDYLSYSGTLYFYQAAVHSFKQGAGGPFLNKTILIQALIQKGRPHGGSRITREKISSATVHNGEGVK